jgi:hypothetical protein
MTAYFPGMCGVFGTGGMSVVLGAVEMSKSGVGAQLSAGITGIQRVFQITQLCDISRI